MTPVRPFVWAVRGKSVRQVTIQPVEHADGPALVSANRASVELHHPWAHPFTDLDGFARYFSSLDGHQNVGLLARNLGDGSVVGVITLSQIARGGFQSAYLGFYGAIGQAGRGQMTTAVGAAIDYAFGDLGLHRVEANVQPGNLRSLALIKRVGFQKEGFSPNYLSIGGEWCDHERWAILSTERKGR